MVKTPLPDWLEPMAATLTEERFGGKAWVFERKFDGIRLLADKDGRRVESFSRNRLPQNMPAIAAAVAALPASQLILDGEVSWDGHSSYHVFDVLWIDGRKVGQDVGLKGVSRPGAARSQGPDRHGR